MPSPTLSPWNDGDFRASEKCKFLDYRDIRNILVVLRKSRPSEPRMREASTSRPLSSWHRDNHVERADLQGQGVERVDGEGVHVLALLGKMRICRHRGSPVEGSELLCYPSHYPRAPFFIKPYIWLYHHFQLLSLRNGISLFLFRLCLRGLR